MSTKHWENIEKGIYLHCTILDGHTKTTNEHKEYLVKNLSMRNLSFPGAFIDDSGNTIQLTFSDQIMRYEPYMVTEVFKISL